MIENAEGEQGNPWPGKFVPHEERLRRSKWIRTTPRRMRVDGIPTVVSAAAAELLTTESIQAGVRALIKAEEQVDWAPGMTFSPPGLECPGFSIFAALSHVPGVGYRAMFGLDGEIELVTSPEQHAETKQEGGT